MAAILEISGQIQMIQKHSNGMCIIKFAFCLLKHITYHPNPSAAILRQESITWLPMAAIWEIGTHIETIQTFG